jgi:hypothetical protein
VLSSKTEHHAIEPCVALPPFKFLELMNGNSLVFRYILRSEGG